MKTTGRAKTQLAFERLPLSELRQGRHGKHHDLTSEIARQVETLAEGEALKVAVDRTEVTLPNLRSAITRAMAVRGTRIATVSDGEHLFIWKKTQGTAKYERKTRARKPRPLEA